VPRALDEPQEPEIRADGPVGHLLDGPGLLVRAPVQPARDVRAWRLDLLAREDVEVARVPAPRSRPDAVPVQAALEARPRVLGDVHGKVLVREPGVGASLGFVGLLGHVDGDGLGHGRLQRHDVVVRELGELGEAVQARSGCGSLRAHDPLLRWK